MSFIFNRQTITLENYKQFFNVCTPDILDEIRSAVLDDTQIAKFIEPCGTDSYKLGQIRMALREMIPVEYINENFTGKTIYNIRRCFDKGYDCSFILKYLKNGKPIIETDTIETLVEFCYLGADLSKVDFTEVPKNIVNTICSGLYHGFPMWLCVGSPYITEKKLSTLMRGMQLGIDIQPFINRDWQDSQLILLFSYAKELDLNNILRYINEKFDTDLLNVILQAASKNIPLARLCTRDNEGYPIYNCYQLTEIVHAIEEGTITDEMYNPNLSDMDIIDMRSKELEKKNRKLNVSL